MIARAARTVSVTSSATQIRDTTKPPVTRAILRYDGAGGNLNIGPNSGLTYGNGTYVEPDTDYVLEDQSLLFYAIADTGPVTLVITDYEA